MVSIVNHVRIELEPICKAYFLDDFLDEEMSIHVTMVFFS
jgi:hypothetical protein